MRLQPLQAFLLALGLYVALHFTLRLVFSPVLGTDDVEQAICTQHLALGCDLRQPPLYSWLQWLVDQVAGPGLASIFLFKYALLFATYVFLFLAGERLFGNSFTAGIAALSLWLTYPFAVSVHQGVTHSLLLSLMLAASFYVALRLEQRRDMGSYLLLGLLLGLGVLSKYSFVLYASGLALAALSMPSYRRAVLDQRILLSLIIALAIVTPHGLWIWERLDAVSGALGGIGQAEAPASYAARVAAGLANIVSALIQFLAPLWLILLAFYPKAFLPLASTGVPATRQFLGRVLAYTIAMLALSVLAGGPIDLKPRWMHVAALLAPLYLFSRVEAAGYVLKRGYLAVLVALPILVVALWAAQTYIAPKLGKASRFHAPYDLIAATLRSAGFSRGTIVADGLHLAGNLRLAFPEARVLTPTYAFFSPPVRGTGGGHCLLAWENEAGRHDLPTGLADFVLKRWGGIPDRRPAYAQAYYHGATRQTMEVGYLLLPGEACNR